MKLLALIFLITISSVSFSQNDLKGDTILKSYKGDTTDHMIENVPIFEGYTFVEAGYQTDSITNEIFIIKNNLHHLIIITEFYRQGETYGNIIIDTIQYSVKNNQRIIFNFCAYNGVNNPEIIAVMEDNTGNKIYDIVKMAWEIKKHKRIVLKAKKEFVSCTLDKREN